MKQLIITLGLLLFLSGCSNTSVTTQTDDPTTPSSESEDTEEVISTDQIIKNFENFIKSDLNNFSLEISIRTSLTNKDTGEEEELTIRGEITALSETHYHVKMSTNFNNRDFGVELYNIIENNEPLIYTRATFGYPEWIKTRDIAKTEGYTSDQFNDLILIPNGDYTYVETKRIRGQYYHHIKIEMNDTLLQQLLEATGSTAEDIDIGKLQSNFYVDADGIPYIIETEYITSNSVLEIEIELEKVNQVTELVVPERILESAIDVD